jgi:Subtilase family
MGALAVAAPAAASAALTPADIHAAYGLPKTGAAHQTIAVISAYDDPPAQADLSDYAKRFHIPACTTANHCFQKLNQDGATSPLPIPDPTGGQFLTESSVGIEAARGVCQSCSIMLVEARSLSKFDLSAAAATAARAGATVVAAAWQIGPAPDDAQFEADYVHPHTIVVSATGDSGYSGLVSFPATLPGVLAVGGTHLTLSSGHYRSEQAWSSTVSGCSPYDAAAVWQTNLAAAVGCHGSRAIADLAAVAEPGLIVHVAAVGDPCGKSFCEAIGTSVSAPVIAGVIGLAGSAGSNELQRIYEHARREPTALHDVTAGADSTTCAGAPICQARPGYDGPTGLGTPDGLAAFLASGGAVSARHRRLRVTAARNRLSVSRSWTTKLWLRNGNPFAVRGSITIRQGGRIYAAKNFTLGSLLSAIQTLTIAGKRRGALTRLRSVPVTIQVSLRGPAGKSVTVTRKLRLHAP